MEEVVDGCINGTRSSEEFFKDQDEKVKNLGRYVRPGAIILHILGWYLLFIPIITLLTWIPLVGSLLGFAASIAALLFSIVFGGTIACLVVAIAWLVFRPLLGISLLGVVGLMVYFIGFYPDQQSNGLKPGI